MIKKWCVLLILLSPAVYADNYTCPKTFRAVHTGDSMETVKAACGDPLSTTTRTESVDIPVQVMRWVYSVQPDRRHFPIPVFSVSFQNEKVIKIEKNNTFASILGTFSCVADDMLKVGQSMQDVLMLCGTPTASGTTDTAVSIPKDVVVWIYDPGQFQQKVQMEFEDNKLARIKRIS